MAHPAMRACQYPVFEIVEGEVTAVKQFMEIQAIADDNAEKYGIVRM